MNLSDLDRWQAGQYVGEIFMRIQTPPSAAAQDGVNHRAAPSRIRMADEEPAPPTYRGRTNVVLDQIVVDLKASFK